MSLQEIKQKVEAFDKLLIDPQITKEYRENKLKLAAEIYSYIAGIEKSSLDSFIRENTYLKKALIAPIFSDSEGTRDSSLIKSNKREFDQEEGEIPFKPDSTPFNGNNNNDRKK